jgi:hypothetical protein
MTVGLGGRGMKKTQPENPIQEDPRCAAIQLIALLTFFAAVLSGCGPGVVQSTPTTGSPQPVTIAITSPAPGATVSGTILVTATPQSSAAIVNVQFQVDGVNAGSAVTVSPYTFSWDTTTLANGNHTLTAVVKNTAGNTATSTVVTVHVNNPPPPAITVSVFPGVATVLVGAGRNFTATLQNDSQNKGVNWTLAGLGCSAATCGTLSAASSTSGGPITYTAPAGVPTPPTVTLTAASVADGTKVGTATITLAAPVSVNVTPTSVSMQVSQTQSFTATVSNDSQNAGVTWTLAGSGAGMLSASSSASGVSVVYTAPSRVPSPATVTLTATSVADTSKSASAMITVTAPPTPIDLGVITVAPLIAVDVNNNIDIATLSGSGIFFTHSVDGGNTFSSPITVATSATLGGLQMGLDNLGHITLLWEEWQGQQAFVGVSTDGVSFSTPTRLQAGAACGLGPCTTDPGVYPQLSVTPKGVITVAFYGTVSSPRTDVSSARSVDGGATFTTVSVASSLVSSVSNVTGPQEQEYLLWSSPNGAVSFSASLDAGQTFGPVVTVGDAFASDLYAVVDAGGNLDVAWRSGTTSTNPNNELMFSRSTDQGSTFSSPVVVLSTTEFVIPDYEHLVTEVSGAVDITASADSQGRHEGKVLLARSVDGGATFSSTALIADGGFPTIGLDSCGGINVAWDSGLTLGQNDIFLTRSTDGTTFSPPANLSSNSAMQTSFVPRIAADSRGNTFVVWETSLANSGVLHAFFLVAGQHGITCKP